MKALSDYTIRCTSEQACKAMNLGVILDICDWRHVDTPLCMTMTNNGELIGHFMLPTAEQMIGWLEAQEAIRSVEVTESFGWHYRVKRNKHDDTEAWIQGTRKTRPEATLAAIDVALEYLTATDL